MRWTRQLLALVLFIALFAVLMVALSAVQSRMNAIRIDERLTDTEPLVNAPPVVAFTTVALGGFRGLVADWLWLRSGRMQEEGNYFEMVQLASWIVKLQPRFTAATAFLAWNMSYNVSVTFASYEDRWRWVRRGIELIRDEALYYNPGDPELFHQLGWIYQHKLGKDLDDANRYYKTEMAREMIRLFGDYYNRWDALADAPLTLEKLRAALSENTNLWQLLERNAMSFEEFEDRFRDTGALPQAVADELNSETDLDILERCLRHRWMRQKYRLDPTLMMVLNERYGDLDWRLPQAHAIYWATKGKQAWDRDEDSFKRLQCDRMIFQALNHAFQGGKLIYIKDIKHLEMTPNLGLADAVRKVYEDAMETHGSDTIRGAYQNFMIDAIVMLYKFGDRSKAKEYFMDCKKMFGWRFDGPLDEFVLKELAEDLAAASYEQAQSTVHSYLIQACYALVLDQQDQAYSYERIAYRLYRKYEQFIGDTKDRRALPPYPQMKRSAVSLALEYYLPTPLAERLRAMLPEDQTLTIEPTVNEDAEATP